MKNTCLIVIIGTSFFNLVSHSESLSQSFPETPATFQGAVRHAKDSRYARNDWTAVSHHRQLETNQQDGRRQYRELATSSNSYRNNDRIGAVEILDKNAAAGPATGTVNEYSGTKRSSAYSPVYQHHPHRQHHHNFIGHQQRSVGESFDRGYRNVQPVSTTPLNPSGIYTKYHAGRRVCTRQAPTSVSHHHRGRQIRLVYTEFPGSFSCCPGWTQVTRFSFGCNKPACSTVCLNGGTCLSPGRCACTKQFTGNQCQIDVDECITEKPCAQLCQNTVGGYQCSCRVGYQLQPDGQSCRKNGSDGTAFEARDLEADYRPATTSTTPAQDTENEVNGDRDFDKDYEIILRRIAKLEKLVARSKRRDTGTTDMSAKINLAVENIGEVKRAIESVRSMQREIYDLKNKLTHFEQESKQMQHIASRMADLEARLRIHCGFFNGGNGRGNC
ncbi:uncharacterized protein LOC105685724 [Athalia rosae]|uniref:uncharacterized protein LOC105685724 n=1 Tax=Athalia rosae TaxID=37344 RepID=UPI0020343E80|nr:uncharacterized protein LOC105685724 [Athalia rosae]